ncbi:MAG: hypothetical protein ACM3X5_04530, partial [Bacillota bacterium]
MTRSLYRLAFLVLAAALGLGAPAFALAQRVFSAEVPYSEKVREIPSLRLPAGYKARLIALANMEAGVVDSIREQNTRTLTKRWQVGVGRDVVAAPSSS